MVEASVVEVSKSVLAESARVMEGSRSTASSDDSLSTEAPVLVGDPKSPKPSADSRSRERREGWGMNARD